MNFKNLGGVWGLKFFQKKRGAPATSRRKPRGAQEEDLEGLGPGARDEHPAAQAVFDPGAQPGRAPHLGGGVLDRAGGVHGIYHETGVGIHEKGVAQPITLVGDREAPAARVALEADGGDDAGERHPQGAADVATDGHHEGDAVGVERAVHVAHADHLVDLAVAVFIHATLAGLGGQRVDEDVGVVAVAVFDGDAVAVGISAFGLDGWDRAGLVGAVAVLVDVVFADVVGPRMHARIGVVAVATDQHHPGLVEAGGEGRRVVAVAVQVEVGVPDGRGEVFVHVAVAVVVRAVAVLGGVRVHTRVVVVAVAPVGGVAGGLCAGVGQGELVAEPVLVFVREPDVGVERRGFVDRAVAVGVDPVAELVGAGVDHRVRVVAVAVGFGEAVAVVVVGVRAFVHHAVAVVIDAVRRLGRAGVHGGIAVVAVRDGGVAVAVHVPGRAAVIGQAVAVVVGRVVADLARTWVGARIRVVAVAVGFEPTVAVTVRGRALEIFAITVVVEAVAADLRGARVDVGVGLVAVDLVVVAIGIDVGQIRAVAVLVDPVVGDLGGRGADVRIAVVAVGAGVAVAIAVDEGAAVGIEVIHDAVAVVVEAVGAVLSRTWKDVGILVVAVAHVDAEAVAVPVDVVAVEVETVAVVVQAVAADLGTRRVDGRIRIVAVEHCGVAVAVRVLVDAVVVDHTVAVLVRAVTDLHDVGIDIRIGIVAVTADQHIPAHDETGSDGSGVVTVAVEVRVRVPGGCGDTVVDHAVAVVVRAVAVLGGAGVDAVIGVEAVAVIGHVARGLVAGDSRDGGVAVGVGVGVGVPGGCIRRVVFVHVAVAVVVVPVAVLGGRRVDGGQGVVAVGRIGDVAHRNFAGVDRVGRVAVAIDVTVVVPGGSVHAAIVDLAVAVVIEAVAEFGRAREGRRIAVVALFAGRETVAVQVGIADRAVTVVVVRIGAVVLGDAGVEVGVEVVAVTVQGDVTAGLVAGDHDRGTIAVAVLITILVPGGSVESVVLIAEAVAVVVDPIAVLGGAREGRGLGVVAVASGGDVASRRIASENARAGAGVFQTLAVAVAVRVRVEPGGDVFVDRTITVVIELVARLGSGRVGGGVGVIAVARVRDVARGLVAGAHARDSIAVVVAVRVRVEHVHDTFIDHAVAVLIHTVAELGRSRVHEIVEIVAIARVGHEARGLGAGGTRELGIAVAIHVDVGVPDGRVDGVVIVDLAVAVVVATVAVLGFARAHARVGVVAVGGVRGVAGRSLAGHDGLQGAAVAVGVEVGVELGHDVLVHVAVAVVVDQVAELDRGRVDGRVEVVAVGGVEDVVLALVGLAVGGIAEAVAVVVVAPGLELLDTGVVGGGAGVGRLLRTVRVLIRAVAGTDGHAVSHVGVAVVLVEDAVPVEIGEHGTTRQDGERERDESRHGDQSPWSGTQESFVSCLCVGGWFEVFHQAVRPAGGVITKEKFAT